MGLKWKAIAAGPGCVVAALGKQFYTVREILAEFLIFCAFLIGIGAALALVILVEQAGMIAFQKFRLHLALSAGHRGSR